MEKKNTFTMLVYMKKTRKDKNGKSPLYLRISYNANHATITLHESWDEELWSTNMGMAIGNDKFAKNLNRYLTEVKSNVYDHFKRLRDSSKAFSVNDIRDAYLGIETKKGRTILEVFEEHNEKARALKNIDFAPATVQRYEVSKMHTRDFMIWKYKKDDLLLTDITWEFLGDYELYLKTVRNCAHNTALKYLKNFKKIVRIAMATGELTYDPFANYKMKLKPVDRGFLTEEELDKIIKKDFKNDRLDQVRDCFLFSCFTGLAYADIHDLNDENIVTGTDGGKWIKIKRKKTSNLSSIPILKITQKIIEKYQDHPECIKSKRLLPVKSNQKMNCYLQEIADVCKIDKHLTSHVARHTFATTVTLNNNVPIETVSKMLGHSSIEMTRVYARLLDKKVGQDMKHLDGKYDIAV